MAAVDDAVSFRCDRGLKNATIEALNEMQVSLSDVLRDTMKYIAENKRLPVSRHVISKDDAELLKIVRERAAKPRSSRITMTLDELAARHDD
ncbi:hypothetical protein AD953_03005 [Acetobacter malorum]|uniref:Uncharacterized protein n=1 Tax=Acetobacter malorum TaxID=178901 RepID=A0A149VH40_9PROT|nr:type II toxin-antitoxin system RelB/DinJ family antitoxin [Acetobacter malorum]KXV79223.1 hypothetical protein AD953_03005 [Acetobacter malorum]